MTEHLQLLNSVTSVKLERNSVDITGTHLAESSFIIGYKSVPTSSKQVFYKIIKNRFLPQASNFTVRT